MNVALITVEMPAVIVSLAVLTVNFPHSFLVFFALKMLLEGQEATGEVSLAMTTVEMLVIIVSLAVLTVNSLHRIIVFLACFV